MTACIFTTSQTPRAIKGQHADECDVETCKGCLPCGANHCRVCGKEHHDGTCAACLGETRDDLHAIGTLSGKLAGEAVVKGVNSEAFALLSPAADPEAWGHITTSLHVGRLPVGYLRCDRCDRPYPCDKHADGEMHPLFVLGTWDMVWRDALEHETDETLTIATGIRYLDQQMSYMAGFEDAPFEDFARDLRKCRAHLEAVLYDGEHPDKGAPCLTCRTALHRCWKGQALPWSTKERPVLATEDGWGCPRCPPETRWYSEARYTNAMKLDYIKHAEWLTDADMEMRSGVGAGTVRSWAREPKADEPPAPVRKKRDSGRTVYSVADVVRVRDEKGMKCA